ncbi:hypothetical protein SKAU_G00313960 [Synaphobranchus kaupii]|uniref:Uncharacterized protein n=1 Tax=Synaphobranchus kaupii TaxID=118154 RepID=A0A9Q1ILI4_SYNKA|nr:hypothetical protein SKAU_G00313960 [Synaphobranchus kaupii]
MRTTSRAFGEEDARPAMSELPSERAHLQSFASSWVRESRRSPTHLVSRSRLLLAPARRLAIPAPRELLRVEPDCSPPRQSQEKGPTGFEEAGFGGPPLPELQEGG